MKYLKICLGMICTLFFVQSVQGEMKDRKFTQEEIKKMAETKAIIETKLGNIELKFFPDVAPIHVNNFY
jgi:peptidyl-prolyl cis-trans isomerase B (cyclophilin B)